MANRPKVIKQTQTLHLRASPAARRHIRRLIDATRADEFKGGRHPDERDDIEQEFKDSRDSLELFIARLEARNRT